MSSTILKKIKAKVIHIDIEELMERLKLELKITTETDTEETSTDTEETTDDTDDTSESTTESSDNTTIDAESLLEYALYDTLLIILDITHLKKVDESLYSIWVNMIKDYWYLNRYDKLINSSDDDEDDENMDVSSIKTGDTQVNFSSKSSSTTINGVTYSTGSINFDENILREKYKKDLYRHRIMRW